MPNRNYEKGRRFEYKVKEEYEDSGCIVVRASGSKSPFDLVALRSGEVPILIQCKVTNKDSVARRLAKDFVDCPPLRSSKHYTQQLMIKIGKNRMGRCVYEPQS